MEATISEGRHIVQYKRFLRHGIQVLNWTRNKSEEQKNSKMNWHMGWLH